MSAVEKPLLLIFKPCMNERRGPEKGEEAYRTVEGEPGDEVAGYGGRGVAWNEIAEEVAQYEYPRPGREDDHEPPVPGSFSPCCPLPRKEEQEEGYDSPCERDIKKDFAVVHYVNSMLHGVTHVKRGWSVGGIIVRGLTCRSGCYKLILSRTRFCSGFTEEIFCRRIISN